MDAGIPPILTTMLDWIQQYPVTTNALIFGVAFLESLFIVGIPVPGALLIISFGALVALGYLDPLTTILLCIAGAIAGDGVSFWIGHHYKSHIKKSWLYNRYQKQMRAGERFFEKHGGKSIAFGRFVGPVRAVIPTIAGMMGMSPRRFTVINILSAIAWAPAYLLPGMVFGASLELASEVAIRLVVIIMVVIIALMILLWFLKKLFRYMQPRAESIITAVMHWARRHPLIGPPVRALVDPHQPESPALILFAVILITCGILFFYIMQSLPLDDHGQMDKSVYAFMNTLRTPWMTQIMVLITMLADAWIITLITTISIVWLLSRHNLPAAMHLGAAIIFGAVLTRILKVTLHVPRPDTSLFTDMHTFSFPSGHVTMSVMLYGFLAIIISRELRPDRRLYIYLGFGTLIGLIALSRLYLGVHWLSDILGGLALGLSWITLLGIAYRRHASPRLSAGGMLGVTLASMIVIGLGYWHFNFEREWTRYTAYKIQITDLNNWQQQGWQNIPDYRRDLAGTSQYPFNVQWTDTLEQIKHRLTELGWQPAKRLNGKNFLQWMSQKTPLNARPVLPQVHQGQHDQLAMTYQSQDNTWIIRFWHSGYRWQNQDIWTGQAARLSSQSFLRLFYYPVTGLQFNQPVTLLQQQTPAGKTHLVTRQPPATLSRRQWNGKTLLIDLY